MATPNHPNSANFSAESEDTVPSAPLNPTKLPAPLLGCLICHAENSLSQSEGRRIPFINSGGHPLITCSACGSIAFLDWDESRSADDWRIRYRSVADEAQYAYAKFQFQDVGWLPADEALDISTDVYIQRQRLAQVEQGDVSWLKPSRLSPPPPLMRADENVYLTLKSVTYYEASGNEASNNSIAQALSFLGKKDIELDTGVLYVTDSKVHLLGQRRDHSLRLSEIKKVSHDKNIWRIHINIGGEPHYYQGGAQTSASASLTLSAELIAAVITQLIPK